MNTAKPAKRQRRARVAQSETPAKVRTITVAIPESATPLEAKSALSECIPGWNQLGKKDQRELAEIAVAQNRQHQPVKVTLTRKPEGGKSIAVDGTSEVLGLLKLQKTFAAVSIDPVNARASELLNYLGSVDADSASRYNAALSFIESMEPQNQAEALLLVQMYVTHDAAIRSLSMIGKTEWMPQTQTFGNLASKLLRVSQGQMEALARMRRGGEQVVRHIHVDNRGGQAVIAENVQTGGQQNGKIDDQSHATGAAGIGPALLGADPFGGGMPFASREGAEALPHARRD